jgi:hypothetical protein
MCGIEVAESISNDADPMAGSKALQLGRKAWEPGYKEPDARVSDGVYRDEAFGCGFTIFCGPIQATRQFRSNSDVR